MIGRGEVEGGGGGRCFLTYGSLLGDFCTENIIKKSMVKN